MFEINDFIHLEVQGRFSTLEEAIGELKLRAELAWDEEPNRAPCTEWRNCGREYCIIEYDDRSIPWQQLSLQKVLEISAKGVKWSPEFE